LAQLVAAVYRVGHSLDLEAGEKAHLQTRKVGLGHMRCEDCIPEDKAERGCPLEPGYLPGRLETQVDDTGDEAHDWIRVCPRGLQVLEPALGLAVARLPEIEAAGGPGVGWSGRALGLLPLRVSRFWAILQGVSSRFAAEVRRVRAELERAALETRNRLKTPPGRRVA
jgi:hypothetical protein